MRSRFERYRSGFWLAAQRALVGALLATSVVGASSALARCGTYGGDPHAGYRALTSPDNAWRVWYLAPPWVIVRSDMTETLLRVPPAYGPPDGRAIFDGIMDLTVRRTAAASPEAAVAAWVEERRAAMGWRVEYAPRATWVNAPSLALAPADAGPMPPIDAGASAPSGAAGVAAVEGAGTNEFFYERCVAARLADGGVVVLLFHSVRSVAADPEVTAMIRLFEPRPPAAAGVRDL